MNAKETEVLNACMQAAISSDDGDTFIIDDLYNLIPDITKNSLKGYLSQLVQKGKLDKLEGCYYDFMLI